MNIEDKKKIYDLIKSGRSFNSVARELGFGKTTIHTNFHTWRLEHENRSDRSDHRNDFNVEKAGNLSKMVANGYPNIVDIVPPLVVPAKLLTPIHPFTQDQFNGPIAELMGLMPPNFKGIIESNDSEDSNKFAWKFGCFLANFYIDVELISEDYQKLKLVKILNTDPGHDKIKLWKCNTIDQIKYQIERSSAGIFILNNFQSLKIGPNEWEEILKFNPNKAIIGVKTIDNNTSANLHFVARIENAGGKRVFLNCKYGVLQDFPLNICLSDYYTFKK